MSREKCETDHFTLVFIFAIRTMDFVRKCMELTEDILLKIKKTREFNENKCLKTFEFKLP